MENVTHLVSDFKKYLSTSGRQLSTVNSYATDIKHFVSYLREKRIGYTKVELINLTEFTEILTQEKKESTNSVRRKIISIRQFYKFLSEVGYIEESPFTQSIIPERKENLPKLLRAKDVEIIFESASKHPNPIKSTRDLAILHLLSFEGLKVSEIINLRWLDFLSSPKNSSLSITGEKKRTITLEQGTAKALNDYQKILDGQKNKDLKTKKIKFIFLAFKGKELSLHIDQITRHGLKFLLYEIGLNSHIKKLNTELLRHYAIRHLLSRENDLEAVKKHLGLKRAGNILKHLVKKKLRDI